MTFIKTISTKNTPASLTLKSGKVAASTASSTGADKIGDVDLITGSNFSALGVSQKIISGAALQDIGRVDQIIGSTDRGSTSVMDQVGLQSHSVQMPWSVGGGMLDALDPESFIQAHDRTGRIQGVSRGARMHDSPGDGESAWAIVESKSITDHQYGTLEQETLMRNSGDKEKNEYIRESVVTTKEGGSVQRTEYYDSDVHQDGSQTVWHEETTTITDEDGNIVSTTTERKTVEISASGEEKVVEDSRTVDGESTVKMDNPMNDNSAPPMNEKNDPLGVIRKHDNGLKGIKDVNPYIDPIVQGAIQDNSGYTNTSLDAASLSNGGTSTGSWNNPYGFGGYSGPSMDAISLSIGGTSTGTDWL